MAFEHFTPVRMADYTSFKKEFDQKYGAINWES
jgi:hypothetical protein